MVKKLLKIAAVLVLVFVVLVVVAFMYIDSIAKTAIQSGGTYALGVETKVSSVSIGVFRGHVAIDGLNVANPPGFASKHFLDMKHSHVDVTLGTLMDDVVVLPEFVIENLDIHLDKNASGANYRVIMDNIAKIQGTSSSPAPTPTKAEGESGKKFVIKKLRLSNITISAQLIGAPGAVGDVLNKATDVNVKLDTIELTDVGKTGTGVGGTGVSMGQLAGIIVQAVLSAAADKAGGLLPGDMFNDLKSGLGGLKPLADMGVGMVGSGAKLIGDVGKGAAEAVGDVGKKVGEGLGEGVKGIGDGLKGILPGGAPEKK